MTAEHPLGEVLRDGDTVGLRFERLLSHSPERVFDLHPSDAGTRLVFTTWVVDTSAGVHKTAAGYHVCLDQFVQLLDTDAPPPFIDRDPTPYEEQYGTLLGL